MQQSNELDKETLFMIQLIIGIFDFMFLRSIDPDVISIFNTNLKTKYSTSLNIITNVFNNISEFLVKIMNDLKYEKKHELHRELLNILYNNIYDYYSLKETSIDKFIHYFNKMIYQIYELHSKHSLNVIYDVFKSIVGQLQPEYNKIALKMNKQQLTNEDIEKYLIGFKRCHDSFNG